MVRIAVGKAWLLVLVAGWSLGPAAAPACAVERRPSAATPDCSLYVYTDESWSGCMDVTPGSPADDLLVTATRRAVGAMRAWKGRFPDDLVPAIADTAGDAAKPPPSSRRAILAFLQRELRATIRVDSMAVEISFDSLGEDRAVLQWRVWLARSIEAEDRTKTPEMDLIRLRTTWARGGRWSLTGLSDFAMTFWRQGDAAVATPFPPRPPRARATTPADDGFESEDPWEYVMRYGLGWTSPCFSGASQAPAVDPVLRTSVQPTYPEFAREAQIQGRVKLIVCVDETGSVRAIQIAEGVTGLNEAAVDAVKRWTFEPAEDRNGNPVSALVVIPVDFHF